MPQLPRTYHRADLDREYKLKFFRYFMPAPGPARARRDPVRARAPARDPSTPV